MQPLLINDVPIACINQAAIKYHVPAMLIISILGAEGGYNGLAKRNKNGTYDYGPMQVNSIWLRKISKYGYTKKELQYDACKNVSVGAWILGIAIADSNGDLWSSAASYHSNTFKYNQKYAREISKIYGILNNYLS